MKKIQNQYLYTDFLQARRFETKTDIFSIFLKSLLFSNLKTDHSEVF